MHAINVKTIGYEVEHPGCQEFGIPPPNVSPAIMKKPEEKPAEAPPAQNPVQSPEPNAAPLPSQDGMPLPASSPQTPAIPQANPPLTTGAPSIASTQPVNLSLPVMPSEDALQKKKEKKCDETFAEYLSDVSKMINKDCYKQILKFVFLFRECLNHYGDRLNKSKQVQGVVPPPAEKKPGDTEEYCLTNNAEQAPEVSNEFVTVYLEELKAGFERLDTIEITQNFCNWLYTNGYTCSKLSLIQESTQ